MVDIFDEVEEEMRQDRYQTLLKEFGPWVAGIAAVIVLGVAGYQFWDWRTQTVAEQASDQYMAAASLVEAGQLEAADTAFAELAANGPKGYSALALMSQANLALRQGDRETAIEYFNAAAEKSPDSLSRDLARYKALLLQFDDLSYDDLSIRLQPLIESDDGYSLLARELVAAAAMRDGRWLDARNRYELLAIALDAPPGLAQRVGQALAYINQNSPDESEQVEKLENAQIEDASLEEEREDKQEDGQ